MMMMIRNKDNGLSSSAAQQQVIETLLRKEASKNYNKTCCNCNQRGPTYVNLTTGSFVCSRCSGIMRGLTPPHRVKSISMATFTTEEIDLIKKQGNDYCKARWLGLYEGEPPVFKDEQTLKDYLSDVYEKKRYFLDENSAAAKRTRNYNSNNNNNSTPPQKSTPPKENNNLWNPSNDVKSPIVRQPAIKHPKTNNSLFQSPIQAVQQMNVFSSPVPAMQSSPCPKFPVDFSSADIYNSSQINNSANFQPVNKPIPSPFANFDNGNANVVTQDRYAALADLDFEFRQQHQAQETTPSFKPPSNANSSPSMNPFHTNASMVNGNPFNCSNPFMVGPSVTGHSKNPFL